MTKIIEWPKYDFIDDFGDMEALMQDDTKALDTQVGGSHYQDMAIQPIEFIQANRLFFCEGNVVKYVVRWRTKNGLEDLKKARHYLDLLIEENTPVATEHETALAPRHTNQPIDGNK
jgi:hypothetical protein